jgi:hypothetical protein
LLLLCSFLFLFLLDIGRDTNELRLAANGGFTPTLSRQRNRLPHVAPQTLKEAILSAYALFSKTRIEVSGSGPRDVAKELKDQ